MKIVLNDLSFSYQAKDIYEVYDIVDKFVEILIDLKRTKRNCKLIFNGSINGCELMKDYPFLKLYNDKSISKDKKSLLLSTLQSVQRLDVEVEDAFCYYGLESSLCYWGISNQLVALSLNTDEKLDFPILSGQLKSDDNPVELRNICCKSHIDTHVDKLGIRVYEANPKHRLGSNWGSPMDLEGDDAQAVLDCAILYEDDEKCLINYHNGKYYVFRRHINNCYHGYIHDSVPENIKLKFQ